MDTKQESVDIHLETHSRTSSSSSSLSSSSYLSPPKNLPDTEISPTDSPPVQVMDRDDNDNGNDIDQEGIDYDPNRIPSSVFDRSKSNIPAEWSCTSNESLFSIHLGRNSFSVYGNDLMTSGELLAYSTSLPMPPPPGSEPKPVEEPSKVVVVVDDSDKEEEVVVVVEEEERHKEEKEEEDKRESHDKEQQQHPVVSWKTPTPSYRSTHSSNSAHSFSFPILAGSAASEPANAETEEEKKQGKESEDTQQPEEAEGTSNQKQSMCRWFSCFPPCPWCCASRSPCSCS